MKTLRVATMEQVSAEQFVIETPENIRFGYDVADIGSRFLAILIDSLIQGAIYMLLFAALIFVSATGTNYTLPRPFGDALGIGFILTLFVIQFGYFMFLEIIMNGQTPGKRLFHLRVIKDNGYPLAPLDSVIRNTVRVIDFFPFAYGVGVVTMFLNRRAKRLGDFAASTLVVKMREEVRLQQLTPLATIGPSAPPPVVSNVQGIERLDEKDIELAESFLKRRSALANQAKLAPQIAARLGTIMSAPADTVPTAPDAAVQYIRGVVDAYRAARRT